MVRRTAVRGIMIAAFVLAAATGCGDDGGGQVPGAENGAPMTAASAMTEDPASSPASGETGTEDGGAQGGLQAKLDEILQATPITFQPQSAELTDEAKQALGQVAEAASAEQDAKLQVVGTAGYEDADKATKLGQERADAVRDELVAAGVAEDRVEATSKGNEGVLGDAQKAVTVDISVVE
ncbi:Outer membrane protein OmpA [Amycolatopsis marina]|uniref:Outer membrane protein OmpA n=1 Tax=Amycolatopsis marina TaxID=490629 RepID=A0A1I1BSE6_9PSEU|nr:OmpA family protein [Amycolatopsis marina]SFB51608.1 Outer membrane protein OmpA [Amycolatopsis marina]